MSNNDENTRLYETEELKQANIRYILQTVNEALQERGYNPVTQIVGYLLTNDPAYISNHKKARTLIQSVDRDDILKEIVRSYLEKDV